MGLLLLARDHADINVAETGLLQPLLQVALRETEPGVAVGLPCLFKAVAQQVENEDAPRPAQQPVGRGQGRRRVGGVMAPG